MSGSVVEQFSVIDKYDYSKALKQAHQEGIPLIVTIVDDFPSKHGVVAPILNALRESFGGSSKENVAPRVMLLTMPVSCPDGFGIGFNKVLSQIPSVHFEDVAGRPLTEAPIEGDKALNAAKVAYVAKMTFGAAKSRFPASCL